MRFVANLNLKGTSNFALKTSFVNFNVNKYANTTNQELKVKISMSDFRSLSGLKV